MPRIISRGQFKDHITKYLKLAKNETIIITVCKKPEFVLCSIDEYDPPSLKTTN